MAVQREIIYLGRDNAINLLLKTDGSAYDLSSASTIEAVFSGVTISSTTHPAWFDWLSASLTTGEFSMTLGYASGNSITSGTNYKTEIIVYDSSNTSGVMWGTVPIKVTG